MSRARHDPLQTAAAYEIQGGGCFSAFWLPPLAVLLVGFLLAIFAFKTSAQSLPMQSPPSTASRLSPVFTPEVLFWSAPISRWAAASSLDPNLVADVMQIESCGDPFARSRAGALGLFQVMPYHFAATDDPFDPDTNALRGMNYLGRALERANNDVRLALAGYNGGISLISLNEWFWPAETSRYTYWGNGIYEDAVNGAAESARLAEWLAAGGTSLCNRARQRLGLQ
jgi:soluble lytic murein transglycosylase-like protein